MFKLKHIRSFFEYAPSGPYEFVKYCKLKYRYSRECRIPKLKQISADELQELLELYAIAKEKTKRPASCLECSEPITDTHDPLATSLGCINILPEGEAWPEHEETPMLPLLQLRVSDLVNCPDALMEAQYLLVWCGIDAYKYIPLPIHNELSKLTKTNPPESEIIAFHQEHAEQISMEYSPDGDVIRVVAIGRNSPFQQTQSINPYKVLKPHAVRIEHQEDSIDHNESRCFEILTRKQAKRAETLLFKRETSYQQDKDIDAKSGNHESTKIGGWPSNIQHFVDFDGKADFVLQIVSDEKIGLMIGDMGTIYIGFNHKTKEWVSDWTCY